MRRGATALVGRRAYTRCQEPRHDSLRTPTTEVARPRNSIPGYHPLREIAITSSPHQATVFITVAVTKGTALETGTRITIASPARGRS